MIISEEKIEINKIYRLHMDLPEEQFGRNHLDFEAKSIYCHPDITPQFYNIGFQLVRISPDDIDIISHIIKDNVIRD